MKLTQEEWKKRIEEGWKLGAGFHDERGLHLRCDKCNFSFTTDCVFAEASDMERPFFRCPKCHAAVFLKL